MTSRRRRPHYRPAAIGYRALRCKARLPRQAGLTGVHLRSVLRFASGFHPTRPRGKGLGCAMPASVSCSCLRLLVASNGPHEGLSPSVIHPCPTHLSPSGLRSPARPAHGTRATPRCRALSGTTEPQRSGEAGIGERLRSDEVPPRNDETFAGPADDPPTGSRPSGLPRSLAQAWLRGHPRADVQNFWMASKPSIV